MAVSGILAAVINSLEVFGILRVISGIGGVGLIIVSFVYTLEITTPAHVLLLQLILKFGFVLGQCIFALEAYFIR